MAFDAKCIQVFLRKALSFSMKTCYNIVKKYPISSSATALFFLLSMFLPLVFVFLICSVLVSALTVVFYRVFFRADLKGFENIKGYKKTDEKTPIVKDDDMDQNVSASGPSQTTRRRNANEKDRENYTHSSIDDKNVTSPAPFDEDLVDKSAMSKEKIKEVRGQFSGVVAETEGEISDDSEEEDARENTRNAIDWSIDDQINFRHVRSSEIERDNTLEKMIAGRKARKLSLEIKVRNALMSPARNHTLDPISSIKIGRKKHFLANNPDASPVPGSAPSVLLPMHNPFDSPNDLQEEKPIPESFQKEFFADQQKDSIFCRHESFNLGAFPIRSRQDQTFHDFSFHPRPSERCETSGAVNKADKKFVEKLSEKKSTQESEGPFNADNHIIQEGHASEWVFNPFDSHYEEDESEVETEQNLHENINNGSTSSSEDDIPLCRAQKAELLRSLSYLAQKDADVARDDNDQENNVPCNTDRILYEKTKNNSFFGEKKMSHAPSNSLASDLQVEVSEVSSPQSNSSNEKSSIFDDYINKEATGGCEDMWIGSSQLSGVYKLPESILGQTNDYKSERLTASDSADAPPTKDSEHSTNRVVAQMSNSENLEEASPQQVNVVEECAAHDSNGNESFKYCKVMVPGALAEVSIPDKESYCKSLEDTSGSHNKHSYLNLSKESAPVSNEDEPLDPPQRKSTVEGIVVSYPIKMNQ